MAVSTGRRERKKAATRQNIADTALRLFLERGYGAVGIREVAAAADVAVTTLFSHFASKEALLFERDDAFRQGLVRAVADRDPEGSLVDALRAQVRTMVRHCSSPGAVEIWQMIDETPALRQYEGAMQLRHAESLAEAIAVDLGLSSHDVGCRAIARLVVATFSLAREAEDPDAAVDELFRMIDAAWGAARCDRA